MWLSEADYRYSALQAPQSQYALCLFFHMMIISDSMVMVTAHRRTSESNLKSRTRPRDQVSACIAQADGWCTNYAQRGASVLKDWSRCNCKRHQWIIDKLCIFNIPLLYWNLKALPIHAWIVNQYVVTSTWRLCVQFVTAELSRSIHSA